MTPSIPRGVRAHRAAPLLVLGLLALVLSLALVLAPALVPALAAPAHGDEQEADGEATVRIDAQSPGVLAAGGTLSVTATVTNGTDGTLARPLAELGVALSTSATRSSLDLWAEAGPTTGIGAQVDAQKLDALAPGASTQVSFTADAGELGLGSASDWGPRGIAVRLSDGGVRLDVERSFVVWAPTGEAPTLRLSVVAAVTGPAVDPDAEAYDDALAAATAQDARLGRVLEATAGRPEVGWVVDPALVAAASASGYPDVVAWSDRLVESSAGRATFALRAYDPDVAAFAHAGLALPEGTPVPGADPEPAVPEEPAATEAWRTDLAWPADTVPDVTTASLAAASGATTLVVGPDALVPDGSLTYTPTGVARVSTASGDLTALVPDATLTALLTAGTGSDPVTTQRLLAETAVVARERPADARHVLVALPRGWDPDVAAFGARLDALDDASWVELAPVDTMLDAAVPGVERTALPESTPSGDEIPAGELHALDRSRAALAAFATVAPDPAALTRPLEAGYVVPTSVAYRAAPEARTAAVQDAETSAASVTDGISILRGSPILLLAEQQSLPVRVRNDLAQDAEVQVVLRPDEPTMKAPERPTVTVPAGSEVTVPVAVEALGSVNVAVDVEVVSAARPDVRVAGPDVFVVRVRADWESVGTAVLAGLLAVAMVAGIWRTVRRGRSPRRLAGATVDQPRPPEDGAP